jgi:hypothetical protein
VPGVCAENRLTIPFSISGCAVLYHSIQETRERPLQSATVNRAPNNSHRCDKATRATNYVRLSIHKCTGGIFPPHRGEVISVQAVFFLCTQAAF